MMREVKIRKRCQKDLAKACAWYERQQPGLGDRFIAAIDETVAKVKSRPDLGLIVYKTLRRANVSRFPYGVFYQVMGDVIVVVGVIHNRRAPSRWKTRHE